MRKIALLVITITLTACATMPQATQYEPLGDKGGYSSRQIDQNTFIVSFAGNRYVSDDAMEAFLLQRCAEITLENGFEYFVLYEKSSSAIESEEPVNDEKQPDKFKARVRRVSRNEYEIEEESRHIYGKPFAAVMAAKQRRKRPSKKLSGKIKLFAGAKPESDPNAFNAKELLLYSQ